jgi:FKBP-type peptidyl-prolyl cis-trans isomerase
MKIKYCISLVLLVALTSCKLKGVNEQEGNHEERVEGKKQIVEDLKGAKDSVYRNEDLLIKKKEVNKEVFDNGIEISWFEKGKGELLKEGHVYKLDYEVLLEDGSVVDGSKLVNRQWVHFLLGFEMQTKGWEFALKKLHIGDFAEIIIPSELARGKEGIKGLIPPDAKNILRVKVLGEVEPNRIVDGTKVWNLIGFKRFADHKANEKSEIEYDYVISTPSNPRFSDSYTRHTPYLFKYDDKGIVTGLKKGLMGVKKMDRVWILVPADQAYGKKGLLDVVKPNEPVLYDLLIREVK